MRVDLTHGVALETGGCGKLVARAIASPPYKVNADSIPNRGESPPRWATLAEPISTLTPQLSSKKRRPVCSSRDLLATYVESERLVLLSA